MSGWGDLILDTEHARREWLRGFESAQHAIGECGQAWLDKVYRIGQSGGDWSQELGWDYTPINEGFILGIYGLVALQRLDQSK